MAPRIVVVPPSHAETAEIAKKMAPADFEIVMSQRFARRTDAGDGIGRIHRLLPERSEQRRAL